MNYIIGVDIGTTSTKIIAYSTNGDIIGEKSSKYRTYTDVENKGYYEQNPEEIFVSVMKSLSELIFKNKEKNLLGVSFSSAMHGLAAIDNNNCLLTNAILWSDRRSEIQVKKYKKYPKIQNIFMNTGTPIHAMSPLFKVLWIKENMPEVFRSTYKFISIKEYIFLKLFGKYYVDYSIASATGMFNIYEKKWNKDSMELLGIDENFLSEPVDINFKVYDMKKKYLELLGISTEVPFIIGGSDGCMANLGVNDISEGTAVITLGTSAAIRVGSKKPYVDTKKRIFTYILDKNHYILGGAVNNAGIAVDWIKKKFITGIDYKEIFDVLSDINPGSENLVFLPYLLGERAPIWNSEAKGVFFGITLEHEKKHFIRAVLEGIIFSIYDVFNTLSEIEKIQKIYINGGLSRIEKFMQLISDIFNREILVSENYESSCFGAFITAMSAIGEIKDIENFRGREFKIKKIIPNLEEHKKYEKNYEIYKKLYSNLEDMFI